MNMKPLSMSRTIAASKIALAILFFGTGQSHADITNAGAQLWGGSGTIWSSDLGLEYNYALDPSASTNFGTGSTTMTHPPSDFVNGESVFNNSYFLSPSFLGSSQRIEIAPAGSIEGVVQHVHMEATVPGVGYYGLGASSTLNTRFFFEGGTPGTLTTVYYAFQWNITSDVVGAGALMDYAIYGDGIPGVLQNNLQPQNLSGTFSGSFLLGDCGVGLSFTGSGCNFTRFSFGAMNPSGSSSLGGTTMFDVAFAFSAAPIDTMPIAAVPEPETYAMLLAGLGLLVFAERRRKLKEVAFA
jgi:hypothetical protein